MQHAVAIVQHFDYINTNAYEYGGQSIGGALFSRWGKVGPLDFRTRFDIAGTLMGAVNSDYSDLAEVANQERIREYDYGPGGMGGATVSFGYKGKPLFSANYRLDFIYVTNGSIYNGQDPEVGNKIGLDARHWLHGADLRVRLADVEELRAGSPVHELHAREPLQDHVPRGSGSRRVLDHAAQEADEPGAEGVRDVLSGRGVEETQ